MSLSIHPGMREYYNNPGTWVGALAVRTADLEAASEAPSGVGSWLQEAAQRVRTLLDAARAGIDVTTLPEFERWLGPAAAVVFRREEMNGI